MLRSLSPSVDEALAAVTDELAGARLEPESVLRTALGTLSTLRAGTWIATVMSKDPRTQMVVAANRNEPQRAVYAEAMYQHAIGNKFVAFINTSGGASSTANQVVATVGIRTRF